MLTPHTNSQTPNRRREARAQAPQRIGVSRTLPVVPLSDAKVLNVSAHGVAIQTSVPLAEGERLSFMAEPGSPPILAMVLACDLVERGQYRVRCQCLLGEFEFEAPPRRGRSNHAA
ncbi:MAG: hypothetical protein IT443_00565 [Phycisphaeraceae bacterium]|nr:hypothetical protein [Phycisphaeraceae bacterium]